MPMKQPVHPGKIIKNAIEMSGLSVTEAADWLGISRPMLSRLINERAGVSPEMAIRLSKAMGSTPEHWQRMQAAYDLSKAQKKAASINVKRFPQVEPLPV